MERLKKFNEGWKDLPGKVLDKVTGGDAYREGGKKYLSQFKKSYEQRSQAESIIAQGLYFLEYQNIETQQLRYLGALEATMVMEGFIDPGDKFIYQETEKKFLFFKYTEKESYRNLVIRKAKEYLKSKGVL